jgi:hypothetical protein
MPTGPKPAEMPPFGFKSNASPREGPNRYWYHCASQAQVKATGAGEAWGRAVTSSTDSSDSSAQTSGPPWPK